jgi:hypothetical protein
LPQDLGEGKKLTAPIIELKPRGLNRKLSFFLPKYGAKPK